MDRSPEARAQRRAASQHGIITRRQALDLGMPQATIYRRKTERRWIRVYPGVFRIAGVPISWLTEVHAAAAWLGDDAVASHRTAGAGWRFDGVPPGTVEFTLPRKLRSPNDDLVLHNHQFPPPEDIAHIEGIRMTGVGRTLIDLAAVLSPDDLTRALDHAHRRGLTSIDRLQARLEARSGKGFRRTRALRELLDERIGLQPLESLLEAKLLRLLLSSRCLPRPANQYVLTHAGQFISRVDFAYVEARLAVEAEGMGYHSGIPAVGKDIRQHNALEDIDWALIRVTWEALTKRPREVLRMIERVYERRIRKLS